MRCRRKPACTPRNLLHLCALRVSVANLPLSPIIPALPSHSPVTLIIPALTQNTGVGGIAINSRAIRTLCPATPYYYYYCTYSQKVGAPTLLADHQAAPAGVALIAGAIPEDAVGDRAYDCDPLNQRLRQNHHIRLIAPHKYNRRRKSTRDCRELRRYCHRWKIERLALFVAKSCCGKLPPFSGKEDQ